MDVIKKDSVLSEIDTRLWKITDVLKNNKFNSKEYFVILFFLVVYKYTYPNKEWEKVYSSKRNLIDIILEVHSKFPHLQLFQSYEFFKTLIETKIPEEVYVEIFSKIRGVFSIPFFNFFPEIFDKILYRLLESDGRTAYDATQPKGLSFLMNEIFNQYEFSSIYNPFAGLASLALNLHDEKYYSGQELDEQTGILAILRLAAYKKPSRQGVLQGNSIIDWKADSARLDLIACHPPLGEKLPVDIETDFGKLTTFDQFIIYKAITSTNDFSRFVYVVPSVFLHKTSKTHRRLKEYLLNEDMLETIISFPGGLLQNTGISFAILVINRQKSKADFIRCIDATKYVSKHAKKPTLNYRKLSTELWEDNENDALRFVSNTAMKLEGYNLSVKRHFLDLPFGIHLDEVATIIRPQYKKDEPVENQICRILKINSFQASSENYLLTDDQMITSEVYPEKKKMVTESCLLLSPNSPTLRPLYFEYTGIPLFVNSNLVSLRVDTSKVTIPYLVYELYSESVQEQLEAFNIGSTIFLIKNDDILSLTIQVPDVHFQNKYEESLAQQKAKIAGVAELSSKIEKLNEDKQALLSGQDVKAFDEFASLKHTLGTPRQNILSYSQVLISFLENQNTDALNSVKANFKEVTGEDMLSVFHTIKNDVNFISELLERGERGLVLGDHKLEIVPVMQLQKLLKEYKHQNFNFEIVIEPLKVENKSKVGILCNSTLFKVLVDNILSNAHKHGFNADSNNNQSVISLNIVSNSSNDDVFVVEIKNNGQPFPDKFSKANFIKKFSTSDKTQGTGLGGYDINRIATYFNNEDWHLILDKNDVYPVIFRFEFPLLMLIEK